VLSISYDTIQKGSCAQTLWGEFMAGLPGAGLGRKLDQKEANNDAGLGQSKDFPRQNLSVVFVSNSQLSKDL
jgi:hypothetical protein